MNEELRSTNGELQTINDELHDRTGEVDRLNEFLDAILSGLQAGVVVLDPELRVQVWNEQAQELWGLRRDEAVGQHFLNLDIGLPTDQLRPLIRAALGDGPDRHELVVKAVNRRGRSIAVRVLASPFGVRDPGVAGVILTMENIEDAAPGPLG
jgi:two-component system CheB/CheR fusion protein